MNKTIPVFILALLLWNSQSSFSQAPVRPLEPPSPEEMQAKLRVVLNELAETQAQVKALTTRVKDLENHQSSAPVTVEVGQSAPQPARPASGPSQEKGDTLGVNPPPQFTEEGFVNRIIDPGIGGDQRENKLSLRPELFVQARYSTLPQDRATLSDFKSNFRMTRAEMHWSGVIHPRFGAGFEIQYQPANDGDPTQLINDAFLQYYPADHVTFTGGQFKLPFGFDNQQSSADRESPERAMIVEYFFPGQRDRGVLLQGNLGSSGQPNFQYFAGVFNGNRFWADNNRQVNYQFRGRTRFDSIHLAFGLSGQIGHQLLPPSVTGTNSQNVIGFDIQYALHRLGLRAELLAGDMPSTALSLNPVFFAAFRPGRHSAGGAAVATYAVTFRDNVYARYDQVNSDPQTDLTIRAVNFGYFRSLTRSERIGFDYQWKNNLSFNNNAVNTRLQITWTAKF